MLSHTIEDCIKCKSRDVHKLMLHISQHVECPLCGVICGEEYIHVWAFLSFITDTDIAICSPSTTTNFMNLNDIDHLFVLT